MDRGQDVTIHVPQDWEGVSAAQWSLLWRPCSKIVFGNSEGHTNCKLSHDRDSSGQEAIDPVIRSQLLCRWVGTPLEEADSQFGGTSGSGFASGCPDDSCNLECFSPVLAGEPATSISASEKPALGRNPTSSLCRCWGQRAGT